VIGVVIPGRGAVAAIVGSLILVLAGSVGASAAPLSIRPAAAPPNDAFGSATVIGSLPFTDSVDVTDATTQVHEPDPTCGSTTNSVWYRYHATKTRKVGIDTLGSGASTVVALYTGSSLATLHQVKCSTFAHEDASDVLFTAKAGTTYQIQVGGYEGAAGLVALRVERLSPPANDTPAGATAIGPLPDTLSTVDARGATAGGEPHPTCRTPLRTVWFSLTAAANEVIEADADETDFPAFVAVFTAAGLTQVACGIDNNVAFRAKAGTAYLIEVGADDKGWYGFVGLFVSVPSPMANDGFASAMTLGSLPTSIDVSTLTATTQPGEPHGSCSHATGQTLWYRYTATNSKSIKVDTLESSFESLATIYTGNSLKHLSQVACGQVAQFTGHAGTTYWIQLGGYDGESGELRATIARGTPPPNDNVAHATTVHLPFSASVKTTFATTRPSEPSASCSTGVGSTVWYRYVPTSTTIVRVQTVGSDFDTLVNVYSGATKPTSAVTCDDDTRRSTGDNLQSSVAFKAKAGTTYWFQVGGYGENSGHLKLDIDTVLAPANDNFAGRQSITDGFTDAVDTSTATAQAAEPTPSCGELTNVNGASVWYVYHAVTGDPVTFEGGSDFDLVSAVYKGSSLASLHEVACGRSSSVTWTPVAGKDYIIQASGFLGSTGPLSVDFHL
jgi:hypothetical protein